MLVPGMHGLSKKKLKVLLMVCPFLTNIRQIVKRSTGTNTIAYSTTRRKKFYVSETTMVVKMAEHGT
jgi:hypothetical protein